MNLRATREKVFALGLPFMTALRYHIDCAGLAISRESSSAELDGRRA